MNALSRISSCDLFTLANGALGFVAIVYILDRDYLTATLLLFISLIMDGMDGYIARKLGTKHPGGQVLDSISDSVSFVFAPALLIYAELQEPAHGSPTESVQNFLVLACSVSFITSGLYRLARFSAGGYKLDHFVGLPAPGAALLVLLTCMLFGAEGSEPSRMYFIFSEEPVIVLVCALGASFLMASTIPYPKIRGMMAAGTGVGIMLAMLPLIAGMVMLDDQGLYTAFSRTATTAALLMTVLYIAGGPLYERLKGAEG